MVLAFTDQLCEGNVHPSVILLERTDSVRHTTFLFGLDTQAFATQSLCSSHLKTTSNITTVAKKQPKKKDEAAMKWNHHHK
jgi:hypothetical protein